MSTTLSAEITEEASAAKQRADPHGLSAWVQKLGESGMPVFAHTARDISHISDSRDSSAAELARVVLQDAAMTAKLLRVANSPVFNPMGKSISTVSRAVVVLGFQEVRAICLSIAVVESMLKGKQKEHVIEEMARSFHAAVQARSFAKKRKDKSPEEVFIATLLYHLGDMAFWAFAGESAEQLDSALRTRTGQAPDSVQREVLGFVFRDLTLGLSKEWKLGELLEQSLQGKTDKNPRAGNVALGYEMAIAAEKGWKSPEVNQLVERVAENLYLPVEQVSKMVKANAEEAADTATFYGAVKASTLIPVPGNKSETAEGEDVPAEEAVQTFIEPDPMLQLQILRELSTLMESKPDFNSVLEMVLEGMYRGIGMDRTLFALRSPDNRFLMGRYALGTDNESLRAKFQFETVAGKPNLFSRVVDTRQAIWLSESNRADLRALITEQVTEVTCGAEFYVTPIEIHNKVIGLFYADRQPSGRALDEEGFNSFRHFAQQGNLALAFLSGK
jgi:HD-like signal output (HDOD) protein